MNICFGIFVFLALATISVHASAGQNAFLNVLSGKYYSGKEYNDKTFYSSLLSLDISAARRAIADRDHDGSYECPYPDIKCDPYNPWRTIDGSCNNLNFPWWGQTGTPYKRLLKPKYGSQDGAPRSLGKDGYPLENPRTIALKVHYPRDIFIDISNYVTIFGQFIFHDLSHFGSVMGDDGEVLKCKCGSQNPDCINIPIPKIDYYNQDKKCLVQVRSRPSYPEFNCYLPYREQINDLNSWMDLSTVYGNTEEAARDLRSGELGKLRTSSFKGIDGEFLPTGCPAYTLTKKFCFNAGDNRVNQYPLLTSMHTIWMREHNRVADALWKINPEWDDEFLYQLARTITIAEYQHISYNQYLPILLGDQITDIFGLKSYGEGFFMGYDPEIFPNVANEFSTGASRFGHALTTPYESQYDSYNNLVKNNSLDNLMFNPRLLMYPDSLEGFLRGCQKDSANWFSPHLTDYLSNRVKHDMGPHNPKDGFSLSAWNVNRGRDHGVRSYNDYRPLAGLKKARNWNELTYIPKKAIERMKQVYASVDDIDLWTGLVSEYPLPDGVLGPTSAYILARGFRDWKYGDRWWFENGHDEKIRLSLDQIREIKKTSLARIICDNSNVDKIAPNVFLLEGKYNYEVNCRDLDFVDLNAFKWFGQNQNYDYKKKI